MSQQLWQCSKCGALFEDEKDANECEAMHIDPSEVKALSWCSAYFERPFPKTVKVTIKPPKWQGYDYAIYEIKHIGPKGV